MEKIETHLKEAFDNSSVSKYDLFRPKNKTDGTSITGHPYLQETSPFTWLIRKKSVDVSFNPRKRIPDALLQFIYSHIIEQDEDCWVIVGDETGDLGEFMGKEPRNHQASMGWVVIPPKSDLPSLPPSFHVSEDEEHMNIATDHLLGSQGVQLYQFQYASGTRIEGVPLESAQRHLNFWKDTLPLVLNKISEHSKELRRFGFTSNEWVNSSQEPIQSLPFFQIGNLPWAMSWVNIEKATVLAKSPLEHPWLGYPDAVGFINSPRNLEQSRIETKDCSTKEAIG